MRVDDWVRGCDDEPAAEEEVDDELVFVLTHQLAIARGDAGHVQAWVTEHVDLAVRARALSLLEELCPGGRGESGGGSYA